MSEEKTDMQVLIDAFESIGLPFHYCTKDGTITLGQDNKGLLTSETLFVFSQRDESFRMVLTDKNERHLRTPFTVTPGGEIKGVNVTQLDDGSWEAALPLDHEGKETFKVKGKTEDIALMRFKNELTTAIINSLEEATLSK